MEWTTARRVIRLDRPLVMGILNVTPDSFSDGGLFLSPEDALRQAESMVAEGADIIDVGGESTRPGSRSVSEADEIQRVLPVIEAITAAFDVPVSVDTTRSAVAVSAISTGAEIVNDISGLRFDASVADIVSRSGAGLVLMHSRGESATMHSQPPVEDVISEVIEGLKASIATARSHGVADKHIVVDPGIGFGKTAEQNLELLAKLDRIVAEFDRFPVLVGASRKSFLGKLLDDAPVDKRLAGSLAAAIAAVQRGAKVVRVHDVKETVGALNTIAAIEAAK